MAHIIKFMNPCLCVYSMRHFLYSLWNTITLVSSKITVELLAAKVHQINLIKLLHKISTCTYFSRIIGVSCFNNIMGEIARSVQIRLCLTQFIPTLSSSHFVYFHFVYSILSTPTSSTVFYLSKIDLNTFLNIIFYVSSLIMFIYINFQENKWHFVSNIWF